MQRTDQSLPAVAVLGDGPAQIEPIERALRESLGWTIVTAAWNEDAPMRAALAPEVQAHIVVGPVPAAIVEALAGRGAAVVSIGPRVQPELRASCWFPTPPSARILAMLLAQLVGTPRPVRQVFRRKSDMIVGHSPAIEQLLNMLDRVAPSMASVLVTGESGTGKELVARALHYSGPRASGPFVAVNCAAIPESLFESELFGNVRGAFTGAVSARVGVFEAAHGGTLFLDELGEAPLAVQPKLLRVLETGQFTRLGSTEVRECSVRLVTATNRNLEDEVQAGRFREDLYYRIRVFQLTIPPLRERPEDIPPLVSHYLQELAKRDQRPPSTITPAALEKLLAHRWPGNVRELVNALERAQVLAPPGQPIDADHVPLPGARTSLIHSYREARDQFEAQYYAQLLRAATGNISLAAKLSQRTRAQVYEALRRLDLDPSVFRGIDDSPSS